MSAHEHRHVGGHLVVARPGRVQARPGVADDLGEPALDRHVHVLVVGLDLEPVLVHLLPDLGEAALDLRQVVLADDLAVASIRACASDWARS